MMPSRLLFCAWCVLENSLVHYCIYGFLRCITQKKEGRYVPAWLMINAVFTFLTAYYQLPGTFFMDVLVLLVFANAVFGIRGLDLIAPVVIVFTFYTCREGYCVFILSWLASDFHSPTGGWLEQMLVPVTLDVLFLGILRIINKRYSCAFRESVSSSLHVLVLPCVIISLAIRYGLHLDSRHFGRQFSSFDSKARITVLLTMLGAGVIAFVMVGAFCKIARLSRQETVAVLLQGRLQAQEAYIEEARKQKERVSSFRHDMDNHLLIIAGLLRDKRYMQAQEYAQKLHTGCRALDMAMDTGRPVLDVLLREKESHAKQNHITVSQDVAIPENFGIDDMDLCVLFSNILDNAVTACKKETREERHIFLSAKVRAKFLGVCLFRYTYCRHMGQFF